MDKLKNIFSPTLDARRCDHHIFAGFKDAVQNLTRTDGPGNSDPPSPDLARTQAAGTTRSMATSADPARRRLGTTTSAAKPQLHLSGPVQERRLRHYATNGPQLATTARRRGHSVWMPSSFMPGDWP